MSEDVVKLRILNHVTSPGVETHVLLTVFVKSFTRWLEH